MFPECAARGGVTALCEPDMVQVGVYEEGRCWLW